MWHPSLKISGCWSTTIGGGWKHHLPCWHVPHIIIHIKGPWTCLSQLQKQQEACFLRQELDGPALGRHDLGKPSPLRIVPRRAGRGGDIHFPQGKPISSDQCFLYYMLKQMTTASYVTSIIFCNSNHWHAVSVCAWLPNQTITQHQWKTTVCCYIETVLRLLPHTDLLKLFKKSHSHSIT